VVIEMDERRDGSQIQATIKAKYGQRTVPAVFLDGELVGGCDDTLAGLKRGTFGEVDKEDQVAKAAEAGLPEGKTSDGSPYIL
jgi:glutaredoxin-related protein